MQRKKLDEVADWLADFRKIWESRFDQLDNLLIKMKSNTKQNSYEKSNKNYRRKGETGTFYNREFEAPRELVFRAFNDPELLLQWLGSCNMTMRIDHLDSRTGGILPVCSLHSHRAGIQLQWRNS